MSNAERQKRWRKAHPNIAAARQRVRKQKLRAEGREAPRRNPRGTVTRRFIALDGEGAGTDVLGRQNYQLLRAGDSSGRFSRGVSASRLSTFNCLDFILALPADAILVGFFFGYDVTQILRDMPAKRLVALFEPKTFRVNQYTWWQSYGIEYVPKQYFRVCRINPQTCKIIPGTTRTINEVGGFFQKSFVEAISDYEVGDQNTVNMIASNKDRREQFIEIGNVENAYCAAECRLLAELMEKFRATCIEANIVPRHWRGAGHIAARLHEIHQTPRKKNRKRFKIIDSLAQDAYYGGRFEVTTIGRVTGDVWEYDINSAYPAAFLHLPCAFHGRWKKFGGEIPTQSEAIFIADISFNHPDRVFLCGFPIREKGRLYFPRMGSGVYWSPEIKAAINAGSEVRINGGYEYIRKCDCQPFVWVKELYEYRKSIGKQAKGFPIKLGINGLYGKFAQRIGAAPWQDYVMAGLTTAITRAKLIDAYAQSPNDILYIATDALYSRKRLTLDIGDQLGQWEEHRRDGIFIVQPGIYWSGSAKPKTRGIPRSIIINNRDKFENAWDHWLDAGAEGEPPVVSVFVNQFIGLRAALARGKPELAGSWLSDRRVIDMDAGIRKIDFDWCSKRRPYGDYMHGQSMVTIPFPGRPTLRSQGYDGNTITEFSAQLIDREDDPDFVPWGNSGE